MVQITISGVRVPIPDTVRDHATEKFSHLHRFHPSLHTVAITVHEEAKKTYRVDVELHVNHHKELIAHDADESVISALDKVLDKCSRQLSKLHGKDLAQRNGAPKPVQV